jgi:hypothetical protein
MLVYQTERAFRDASLGLTSVVRRGYDIDAWPAEVKHPAEPELAEAARACGSRPSATGRSAKSPDRLVGVPGGAPAIRRLPAVARRQQPAGERRLHRRGLLRRQRGGQRRTLPGLRVGHRRSLVRLPCGRCPGHRRPLRADLLYRGGGRSGAAALGGRVSAVSPGPRGCVGDPDARAPDRASWRPSRPNSSASSTRMRRPPPASRWCGTTRRSPPLDAQRLDITLTMMRMLEVTETRRAVLRANLDACAE